MTQIPWMTGYHRLEPLVWKVTQRKTGLLWWKQTTFDAENQFIKMTGLTAAQVAMLPRS